MAGARLPRLAVHGEDASAAAPSQARRFQSSRFYAGSNSSMVLSVLTSRPRITSSRLTKPSSVSELGHEGTRIGCSAQPRRVVLDDEPKTGAQLHLVPSAPPVHEPLAILRQLLAKELHGQAFQT